MDSIELNTGAKIPPIGLGTWKMSQDGEVQAAVSEALGCGYRLIDTAKIYGNEEGVGQAVKRSGLAREKLFITTKLWNSDQGYHSARTAFDESLTKLGMDYVDLYLIHWPATEQRHSAWRALEELQEEGKAKAIGVSNYEVRHLEELLSRSDTVPAVNQIEFHPFVYKKQKPTLDFCQQHDIVVEAYSPLSHGENLNHPAITKIAKQHKRTNAQIMLRWAIQHDTVPIPKASQPSHLIENIEVFDFELSDDDMDKLNGLSG
ncbi:aldo/keto reductase [Candidatus Saccharibacteria bacterium]|nr:aldo/keto reductase [Candidatus Saccharibacteria bacterium]